MSKAHYEPNIYINEESFTWLFNAYWEKVYALCYKSINSHEDARELTQNIFKSLWERRDQISITGKAEHYLMRSAKLQVINFYRDAQIRRKHHNCLYEEYCDIDNCTENEIMYNQLRDELGILIEALPCQCKLVYELSRNKNLSNKEIASRLEISIKTVEYHLSNANKLLKVNLQHFI